MDISNRLPVNRAAALVTGKGFKYKSSKIIDSFHSISPSPIDRKKCDYLRLRKGRLTVLGYLLNKTSKLVVRCDCGIYTVRTVKAVNNQYNKADMCQECKHLIYLKKYEIYRRTGKQVEEWEIY
jgi:hypothetical protein|tara:strand:+ start:98 stop:469 length:372 start_codon:yes stop_codon:yes gene_type:complete